MDEKLNGIYRVSFDIEIESQDELSLSDLSFLLTEGVGEGLASKAAHLSIEKITKKAHAEPKLLKVGDRVRLNDSISLKTSVYEDDGYLFVGSPSDISNDIGEYEITISSSATGYVNKVDGDSIEVADLDFPALIKMADIQEPISVDLLSLNIDQVEKIYTEGDK